MKKTGRLRLLAAAGVLSISLVAGGATYALFSNSTTNSNNTFTAGTLNITAKRGDVPTDGPMFYSQNTDNSNGGLATGYWAPGDIHTRGLFLENTGSLAAKLATLRIQAVDQNGNTVDTAGQPAYDDDVLFARQARMIIWQIQEFDSSGGQVANNGSDPTDMDMLNNMINDEYTQWLSDNPSANLSDKTDQENLLSYVNQQMYDQLSQETGTSNDNYFQVVKMYDMPLSNMINTPLDVTASGISVESQDAALLGFTVEFNKTPPAGIDQNSMQGKSVYFNIETDWQQARNN